MSRRSIAVLLFASVIAMSETPLQAEVASETPRLDVRGEAVVRVAADQIEFNASVTSEDSTAERALQRNNAKVTAVRKALLASGLADRDIQTGQFNLQPQWSSPPRDPGPEWRPAIVGFVVEHRLNVRTRKLDAVGAALTAASNAGANGIGELRFSLADDTAARAEAIAAATRNALRDAETLARAAGVKRGQLLALVLEPSVVPPAPQHMEMRMMAAAMDKAAVPVDAGEIEVRAAVQLRAAIGP